MSTPPFLKYSSIESYTDVKHLEKIRQIFKSDQFTASEKVHGANFQFIVNEDASNNKISIACAKRTSILEDSEEFYDWRNVLSKHRASLEILYQKVKTDLNKYTGDSSTKNLAGVRVYGELFGGEYPGHGKKNLKPVQKWIYYNTDIDFIVFDVVVVINSDSPDHTSETFLSSDDVMDLICSCSSLKSDDDSVFSLKTVPILSRGSLDEVIEFCTKNVQFNTKIPHLYGLPDIENNFAEGYVVKANVRVNVGKHRGVVKVKNPKFDEIIGFVRHDKRDKKSTNDVSEEVKYHTEMIKPYLTQNRLDNVVSKIGPASVRPKIVGCFLNDAKIDYIKSFDDDDSVKDFEKVWKDVQKNLTPLCNTFVYP
ncbi:RNA ligase 2 [Yasminevirus sp. GU-2018]|uniref:RNA ligase 2 n=1 Tax=Yasminevirus sp. GU-2018 TaxID=2420051 RepID=A0A5K0UAP9_9VIRU|nr:RNA ligase 2 [Yasminevirus sp. GU-2018]